MKNTCEEVHLLKFQAISLQSRNFTTNELPHIYFSRILAIFWVIYYSLCLESKNTYFSKHLSIAASVSTCNNLYSISYKKLFIFIFHSYYFLPYWYNLHHRLTKLNVSLSISKNWFSSNIFNEDSHMLMCKLLNWILFNRFIYKI